MKPIEDHLSGFLLCLQRGTWSKEYNRKCLAMWRVKYGEKVVAKVERELLAKWKAK